MKERAYTVAEIDRMRLAVQCKLLDGCLMGTPDNLRPTNWYGGVVKDATVEDQLRTYMLAGVEPADLEYQEEQGSIADPKRVAPEGLYLAVSAHDIHDVQRAIVEYLRLRSEQEQSAFIAFLAMHRLGRQLP